MRVHRITEAAGALPYIISVPSQHRGERLPVLIFLHGYDEGPPTALEEGVTRHGPLRPGSPPQVSRGFVIVAPQLPARGDLWRVHADDVSRVLGRVLNEHPADAARVYLTGFSFGGNGVFDLALQQPRLWAALWAVDPTRVPQRDPGLPVWVSAGDVARHRSQGFIRAMALQAPRTPVGDRVYLDEGEDHVGSATRAYADGRIYEWLLAHRRPDPATADPVPG